jgi:hypothetical protein
MLAMISLEETCFCSHGQGQRNIVLQCFGQVIADRDCLDSRKRILIFNHLDAKLLFDLLECEVNLWHGSEDIEELLHQPCCKKISRTAEPLLPCHCPSRAIYSLPAEITSQPILPEEQNISAGWPRQTAGSR